MFRTRLWLRIGFFLCLPQLLSAQRFLPLDSLTATGGMVTVAVGGADTTGRMYVYGTCRDSLTVAGRSLRSPGMTLLFRMTLDTAGMLLDLSQVAVTPGGCDLQAGVVLPDGSSRLYLTVRRGLTAGTTFYPPTGVPALLELRVSRTGTLLATEPLFRLFRGRVRAAVRLPAGDVWLGGWFRTLDDDGHRTHARGDRDAFMLHLKEDGTKQGVILGGEGRQQIDVLRLRDDTLRLAGTYTLTLEGAGCSLPEVHGTALFAGWLTEDDSCRLDRLAEAAALEVNDLACNSGGEIIGGAWAGDLRAGDTLLHSRGGWDALMLGVKAGRTTVRAVGGEGDDRVEHLHLDRKGRLFLLLSGRGRLTAGEDALPAPGRTPILFLAAADTGGLRWHLPMVTLPAAWPACLLPLGSDRLWSAGTWHPPRQELIYGGDALYVRSWLDPCSLLHYDLPAEQPLCEDGTDTLDAGEGFVSYLWQPGNISDRRITVRDTGRYIIRVTDRYGCTALDTVHVFLDSVRIDLDVTDETLPEGYNGVIRLTVRSGMPPWHIRWNTGDTTATLTSLQAGVYEVTVTDAAGCELTRTVEVARNETTGLYDLNAYPNPFRDITRILYTLPAGTRVRITLWDPAGKELFVLRETAGTKGRHTFLWGGRGLQNGVYYLRMTSRFGVVTRKIVITGR